MTSPRSTLTLIVIAALLAAPTPARAQGHYGASWRLTYDAANLKLNGGDGYKTSDNAAGTLAWGESYVMMSYAAMYRATGDVSYLLSLADHTLHVLDGRDNKKGLTDFAGKSRPCWQSSKYSADSKGYCWVVHSGMIAYPMAELVLLVNATPALKAAPLTGGAHAGKTLGQIAALVLPELELIVATHDFQYLNGPKAGEGYYRGDPAATATAPSVAGKALPLNQMNAMGRLLVALWKVTGKAAYQTKAKALATYLKNRLTISGQAYVWTYWGSAWSAGDGEDISHAAINVDFAALCHDHGLVFSKTDMQRLGRTLFDKVHLSTNAAADRVDGSGTSGSYTPQVGRWLALSPHEPRVWPVVANILRDGKTGTLVGLANLCRFAPPLRGYTFYVADWNDLGTHRQATAYGANILIQPTTPSAPYALRLGYRAQKLTWVDQWDGTKYHHNGRLAPTSGSAFSWVYVAYDPAIYLAYSGTKALYQFTDSYVSGQGIEVKEVSPVSLPTILTTSAPPATAGVNYILDAKGSGDAPLLWSLGGAPTGLRIDLQTGQLTWTPTAADAPGTTVTLRLTNDSGQATQQLTIPVTTPGSDAAPLTDSGPPPGDQAPAADLDPTADLPLTQTDGAAPPAAAGGGCACDLGAASHGSWPPLLLALAALLALVLLWGRSKIPPRRATTPQTQARERR